MSLGSDIIRGLRCLHQLEAGQVSTRDAVATLRHVLRNLDVPQSRRQPVRTLLAGADSAVTKSFEDLLGEDAPLIQPVSAHLGAGVHAARRPSTEISREVRDELRLSTASFDWDPNRLVRLGETRVLPVLAMYLFENTDLIGTLGLDPIKLDRFLQAVDRGYADLPYHSSLHAAAVLQRAHLILERGRVLSTLATDETQRAVLRLALYIAAVVHDYRHLGVNNSYLRAVEDPLATRYNDRSPLENFHVASAFELLKQGDKDFMPDLPKDTRRAFRKFVIDCVLATDMQCHFETLDRFRQRLLLTDEPEPLELEELRSVTLRLCMKCADLAHTTASLDDHRAWVERLQEEHFQQGDRERRRRLPVSPLMDRDGCGLGASQPGFFAVFVLPMFALLADAYPGAQPLHDAATQNASFWTRTASSLSP